MKRKFLLPLVLLAAFLLTAAAPLSHAAMPFLSLTPDEASVMFLGISGVLLQIIFKFAPKVSDWYQKQEYKGAIMLGFVALTAAVYFGLSCTSLAGDLGIQLSCTVPDLFVVLKALLIIATAQSVTYLYTRKGTPTPAPVR